MGDFAYSCQFLSMMAMALLRILSDPQFYNFLVLVFLGKSLSSFLVFLNLSRENKYSRGNMTVESYLVNFFTKKSPGYLKQNYWIPIPPVLGDGHCSFHSAVNQ